MKSLLYLIALILILAWAVGFFAFSCGGIFHALLVIAVVLVFIKIIRA